MRDLPAALPPRDAPVARLAAREGVAAPAHVRYHLLLLATAGNTQIIVYCRTQSYSQGSLWVLMTTVGLYTACKPPAWSHHFLLPHQQRMHI